MKFFFDNGFAPRLARAINILCKNHHDVFPLKDLFTPNCPDEEWIEELSNDGVWVIVTKDNRIRRKPIWKAKNITTVFLSPGLQSAEYWDMVWKIIKSWPDVIDSAERNPPGSALQITHNSKVKIF